MIVNQTQVKMLASTIRAVDALGILVGISWKSYPAGDLKGIRTGYDLIPNQLQLRLLTEEEKREIGLHPLLSSTPLIYPVERYLVLESKNTNDILNVNHPIKKGVLALQLLKSGGVFLEGIYLFNPASGKIQGKLQTLPIPPVYNMYEFILYEKDNVISILNKLQSVDLETNHSLRIACDRFSRSYNDVFSEDKLIDLCIGLEALFFKDVKKRYRMVSGRGMTIGLACSMLLGKNDAIRNEILNNIIEAFEKRNDVIHGEVYDTVEMYKCSSFLEDYLRRSILCVIS